MGSSIADLVAHYALPHVNFVEQRLHFGIQNSLEIKAAIF